MEKRKITNILLAIAFTLVVLDQFTKVYTKGFNLFGYVHEGMYLGESFKLIGNFVRITFVENPGMAFGIEFGAGKIFLSLFSVFASIALVLLLRKIEDSPISIRIAFTLILAGAVGNLIDRVFYGVIYGESALFYGKVVDFIQVDIPDIDFGGLYYTHWPVFNVADSCVSVGIVTLLIYSKYMPDFVQLFSKKQEEEEVNYDNQSS
jgi:signal peptidase II